MRTMDHQMDDGWDREPVRGMGSYREMEPAQQIPENQPAEPQDLTLGMTALMGIFVAVVLVCAVFFGFGYSTGRTLHGRKPAQAVNAAAGTGEDAAVAGKTTLAIAPPVAKPSAGAPLAEGAGNDQADGARKAADEPAGIPPAALEHRVAAPPADADEDVAPANVPVRSMAGNPAARPGVSAAGLPLNAPMSGGVGSVMVQIAAVVRQADAEMLANALRTNGYAAVVRTEPQDKFLHVQVGPFATRDQAKAMRARLQAAGYNAFLKP